MVDIGGYEVHVACTGDGPGTILVDVGAGGWSFDWLPTQNALADSGFRVCSWDRPGLGLSEAGPLPRTSASIVQEMKAMIDAAGLQTPLLLVGHSFGGQNVRLFASQYPEGIAGVVLVDSGHEDQWGRFEPGIWRSVEAQVPAMRGIAAALRGGTKLPDAGPDLSGMPEKWVEAFQGVSADPRHYEGIANEFAGIPESNAQLGASADLG